MLLHSCPYCGGAVDLAETDKGGFVAACGQCGMSGPEGRTEDEAAQAWSILTTYRMCNHCRRNLIKAYTARTRELKARIAELEGSRESA